MDTDIERDEARNVFRTAMGEPPALGFTPESVVRAGVGRRHVRVAVAAAAVAVMAVGTGSAVVAGRLTDGGGGTVPAAPRSATTAPVPTVRPSGTLYAIPVGDHAVVVLQDAARAVGHTLKPDRIDGPVDFPARSNQDDRYAEGSGAMFEIHAGRGAGMLWALTRYGVEASAPGLPLDPRADLCATDLSLAGTEDRCRMVTLPDGERVRVAHQTGTRPREAWTAMLPGNGTLVEVVVTSAMLTGTEPQLTEPLFTDEQLATMAVQVAEYRG